VQPRESQVTSLVEPPVTLAVREYGDRDAEVHVLLLHGFPDDQRMWEPVVAALPDEWHVITMDNRGAGASSRPRERSAFVLAMLVEDVIAVIDATVPAGAKVHLVGHDWGSTLGWDVVAAATWDPRLEDRLATYTSASGPPLDHLATQSSTWRSRARLLPQLVHSWYILFFLLPRVPELSFRFGQAANRRLMSHLDPTIEELPWGREVSDNATGSIELYRANVVPRLGRSVPWRTSLPIQLLLLQRDAFVIPRALDGLEARCRDVTRVEVDSGHWLPRTDPRRLADLVAGFARAHG
jgi:pimeloyl-ACP methyl ester carboxylesterase